MSNSSSPSRFRTRRSVLLGLAACASAGVAWRALGAAPDPLDAGGTPGVVRGAGLDADGRRAYAWADALLRAEVNAAEVSPNGDIALVIIRPLGAQGTHFGNARTAIAKRGEVWLCNAGLSTCRKLELEERWVWAPMFSPGGRQLAALTTGGDGRVGLAVWDVATGTVRRHERVNIDIYGVLRTAQRQEQAPFGFGASPLQFAWVGEDRILFLASGAEETQFELDGPSSAATYGRLRGRAFDGETSVRVWSPEAEGCFAGRQLMWMDPVSGETTSLYTGDIRGVSLSGDARWAAIMRADGRPALDPEARQNAPLRSLGHFDDPMVSCSLACVRLDDGASFDVPDLAAVGSLPPSRLPVWSHDARRVAVATRSTYSPAASTGDDACWEVEVETRTTRRWPAASAADAEFIAALVASNEAEVVERVVEGRTPVVDPPIGYVGQMRAGFWPLLPGTVSKWVGDTLSLVRGTEEHLLGDACSAVTSPVALPDGGHLLVAARHDGHVDAITLSGGAPRTRTIELPQHASVLCAAADGQVLCRQDAEDASWLHVSSAGGPAVASPFVLNRHLAEVRRPQAREIERILPDGTRQTGILLTPTARPAAGPAPVIVWAYPDSAPSLTGWMTRVNHSTAVIYPFQHLLAQGFAVFQAPLPMTARADDTDPLDYVSASILPWLDILDRQPEVEAGQYGFWGHSDAGYAGLALAATTDRFKAIAVASTFPDLAATLYSANMSLQPLACAPHVIQANRFYYEAEDQRYRVGGSLWRNRERFIQNSALFRLEQAVTPTLLLVGEYDASPRSMEQVYSVLHGKGVPVELAYYWGEGHVITSRGNLHDLWTRSEGFFRRHLRFG